MLNFQLNYFWLKLSTVLLFLRLEYISFFLLLYLQPSFIFSNHLIVSTALIIVFLVIEEGCLFQHTAQHTLFLLIEFKRLYCIFLILHNFWQFYNKLYNYVNPILKPIMRILLTFRSFIWSNVTRICYLKC